MSTIKITNIANKDNNGGPIVTGISTFSSTEAVKLPSGTTAERVGIESGSLRYNSSSNELEFYNGTSWATILNTDRGVNVRGVFAANTNINYINISITSNSFTFGTINPSTNMAACSSSTRGVFGPVSPGVSNILEYITIMSTGNSTDFGDLSQGRSRFAACSSSTRGVFGGGYAPGYVSTIDYITIATIGNASNFGTLTQSRAGHAACSSSTRGLFGGGYAGPAGFNTIDYITIASTGNAIDFGDLTQARYGLAGCSSSTRGLFGGGYLSSPIFSNTNTIDYVTISTTGNATDFGDLTLSRRLLAACSSSTRGVFGGGNAANFNTIDYVTISTTGNATDFGDLIPGTDRLAACSNGHGGLS